MPVKTNLSYETQNDFNSYIFSGCKGLQLFQLHNNCPFLMMILIRNSINKFFLVYVYILLKCTERHKSTGVYVWRREVMNDVILLYCYNVCLSLSYLLNKWNCLTNIVSTNYLFTSDQLIFFWWGFCCSILLISFWWLFLLSFFCNQGFVSTDDFERPYGMLLIVLGSVQVKMVVLD